jgi:hypothetical protein
METNQLKINLTQRILNLNDRKILRKIALLLDNENSIGYDMDGNPISEKEYIADIQLALHQLNEDKLETYTSEEVKSRILK